MNQKLKAAPGIYLLGFMGCGKTTVGRLLAKRLGWDFVDLDEEIEQRAGRPIHRIFEESGEQEFRDLEHAAVQEQARLVRAGRARVVALGGGAFAFERNRRALDAAGLTVWLDAPADTLWERVRGQSHRPLAKDRAAFTQLLAERVEAYAKASRRVDASRAADQVAADIAALI